MSSSDNIDLQETQNSIKFRAPEASDILEKEDKYRVDNMIARGGMAIVFKAKDKNCRRSVALKVIQDTQIENKEVVHRFIEEAQIAAQLDHPNILPIYELNLDSQDNPFYTMKLVKGDTLESILSKLKQHDKATVKAYPLNKLLQIFMKICEAVSFSASKGVIHRDLKPENIMLGEFGEAFIMDWGIAKVLKDDQDTEFTKEVDINALIDSISKDSNINTSATMHGQILGTPSFMAPEQILSSRGQIDIRTDIYALGGILYNMLALDMPHSELGIKELFTNKLSGKIPTPQRRATQSKSSLIHLPKKKIPEALSSICQKAMAIKPSGRYSSVEEIITDLNNYTNGFATQAEGASQLRLIKLLFLRHQRLGVGLLILVTMVILLMTQNYFKLQYAEVESETATSYATEVRQRKARSEINIRNIRNAAQNLLPGIEAQIQVLIDNNKLLKAFNTTNEFLKITTSAKLYVFKTELLIKFSRPLEAQRTIRKGLAYFPEDEDLLALRKKHIRVD